MTTSPHTTTPSDGNNPPFVAFEHVGVTNAVNGTAHALVALKRYGHADVAILTLESILRDEYPGSPLHWIWEHDRFRESPHLSYSEHDFNRSGILPELSRAHAVIARDALQHVEGNWCRTVEDAVLLLLSMGGLYLGGFDAAALERDLGRYIKLSGPIAS